MLVENNSNCLTDVIVIELGWVYHEYTVPADMEFKLLSSRMPQIQHQLIIILHNKDEK